MLKNQKISLDLRIVSLVLLVGLIASIVMWKPWQTTSTRTISVSGESSSKAVPDEYQFMPTYQKKGTDRAAIQKELTDKINEVIAKLKELGVDESNISLASSTYDNYYNDGTNEVTSNTLTIAVNDKDLSQKISDYLVTTAPEGQLSPYATFSKDKQKEVENQLRSEAITDAKKKAEQMAKDLGAKLGKVETITDQTGGGGVFPMLSRTEGSVGMASDSVVSSLPVLPGKQELSYTVQITYQIK